MFGWLRAPYSEFWQKAQLESRHISRMRHCLFSGQRDCGSQSSKKQRTRTVLNGASDRTRKHVASNENNSSQDAPTAGMGQPVGLVIMLSTNVRNGKFQGTRQLSASPVEGVQARASATVFALHLPNHDFRVGVDVKCRSLQSQSTLQGLKQRDVFCNVVVLIPDPFGNQDRIGSGTIDHHPNA
jgi:hypothetical protein